MIGIIWAVQKPGLLITRFWPLRSTEVSGCLILSGGQNLVNFHASQLRQQKCDNRMLVTSFGSNPLWFGSKLRVKFLSPKSVLSGTVNCFHHMFDTKAMHLKNNFDLSTFPVFWTFWTSKLDQLKTGVLDSRKFCTSYRKCYQKWGLKPLPKNNWSSESLS